jgi:5-methylcytosine-specific restriction enzyme B
MNFRWKVLRIWIWKRNDIKDWDSVRANIELKKMQESHEVFKNWNPFKFVRFAYNTIIHDSKIFKIAPGEDAKYWKDCLENNYICIGWDGIGDMRNYADYNEFKHKFAELYDYDKSKTTQKSNEMWSFFSLNAGDIIVANKGTNTVMGIGEVSDKGYEYDVSRDEFKHIVHVNWKKDFDPKQIEPQNYWAFRTVLNITEKLYKNIIGEETKPTEEERTLIMRILLRGINLLVMEKVIFLSYLRMVYLKKYVIKLRMIKIVITI